MAKKPKAPVLNLALLNLIAQATAANTPFYVSQADGLPLLQHQPQLIQVNPAVTDPANPGNVAARITEDGVKHLAAAAAAPAASTAAPAASPFAVITNAVLPASKRGNKGGGAPTVYPFDTMEIGHTFFVPVSEKHADPVKQLGSTISAANAKYAVDTGETKQVERTKRGPGNKAVKAADGVTNVKETATVKVKKLTRKFTIRAVKAGEKYGEWIAPTDGALIGRVNVD